jgi:sigma-B regulation protein RsbU (phosphoserine phosphatase)
MARGFLRRDRHCERIVGQSAFGEGKPASAAPPVTGCMMRGEAEGLNYLELATANPLLGQMTERALKSLMTGSVVVEIGANEHLIRQGTPSDAAYLLVDGEVDVLIENSYGPVHMARLSAGALVGEIGVFTDLPRNASVVAIGPARALRFARDDILAAGNDSPRFLRSVMSALGRHIYTYNHAIAFFTNALAAIEQRNFDLRLLNDLMYPVPELIKFSQTFRRIAEQIMLRQAHNKDMDSAAAIQRAFLPAPIVTATQPKCRNSRRNAAGKRGGWRSVRLFLHR